MRPNHVFKVAAMVSAIVGAALCVLSGCSSPSTPQTPIAPDAAKADGGGASDSRYVSDAPNAPNAILGTWKRDTNYEATTGTITIAFTADGKFTSKMVNTGAANNGITAGCVSTNGYTGTWSVDADNYFLTVTATAGTAETVSCQNTSTNSPQRAATSDELMKFGGMSRYQVYDDPNSGFHSLTFSCLNDTSPFIQ